MTPETLNASMLVANERKSFMLNAVFCILIALFLISLNGLQKFPPLFFVNKVSAGLIVILGILYSGRLYIPKLLKLFGVFIVVSFFSGFFTAIDQELLFDNAMKLLQLLLLLTAISQFYIFRGNLDGLMIALIINALVLAFAGKFLSPDLVFSGKIERYSSITNNSNGFAFQLLLGVIGTLFFYRKNSIIVKLLVAAGVGMLMYYIAISGSRKSLAGFAIVVTAWVYFSFNLKKSLQIATVLFLMALAAGSYVFALLEDTAVVQRLYQLESDSGAADIRAILYREAFEVFQEHPFFGVGLDNFRRYSVSGLYAHSNYMELLADTGIIGFALFFAVYLLVWRNSDRLVRLFERDETAIFLSGINKCIIILFLVIGAGAVQYDNIAHWTLLLFPIILQEKAALMVSEATQEEEEKELAMDETGSVSA